MPGDCNQYLRLARDRRHSKFIRLLSWIVTGVETPWKILWRSMIDRTSNHHHLSPTPRINGQSIKDMHDTISHVDLKIDLFGLSSSISTVAVFPAHRLTAPLV